MKTLRTIPTPWAPYSVMFSHDGTRLAIGGGSWYGGGGVVLVDLATADSHVFPSRDLPRPVRGAELGPTVSSVCFSADDRHLVATTWLSSQHLGPTVVFEVSDLELAYRDTIANRLGEAYANPTPTGLVLHGDFAIVRNHRARLEDLITIGRLPPDIARAPASARLTSQRVVVVGSDVITGNHGLPGTAVSSIVVASVSAASAPRLVPMRDCRRVTAIGACGDQLLTGGMDGEVDLWTFTEQWDQRRLRPATQRGPVEFPGLDLTWAAYTSNSIVGICALTDERAATVSAGGELCLWDDHAPHDWSQLSEPGTPRSLAAHPDGSSVAVGVKQGGFGRSASAVMLVDTRLAIDPAWRSPAVLAMARGIERERSTGGRLDHASLSVLADALEEAGCVAPRLLGHLRAHDARLAGCWIVDSLRGDATSS